MVRLEHIDYHKLHCLGRICSVTARVMEKGGEEIPPTSNGHGEESSKDPQEGETKADASDELQETAKNINIITGEDKGRNTVPLYRDCGTNEKDRGSEKNAKVDECEKTAAPRGHDLHKSCENISGTNQNLSKVENRTFEERNDEEKRNIFSQINYLKFRDNLYEVIEELRIRRSTDSENEERIKQLVTEKHELERKLETEIASNKTLSDQHEQEIIDAKKHSEDKIHQLEDDKQKLALLVERTEKEVTGLKNEIRTLMLSKYSLEKKIKEKDHVIQMQSTAKDKHVIQIVDLEQKTKDVSKQVTGVTEQMERLEENVQAACKLNKKLAYINKHKHCELENCRKDLESSVQQLKKLRIELNRKPNDMARKLQEREKQVENLQQQMDQYARSEIWLLLEKHSLAADGITSSPRIAVV
ncbi:coiled-coil domain-containing protein 73-like [Ptychodera flava]|uniref:coiled-coil domain-containing protein 73-like n=1 Tax=Ptychodera flava TaxID=63121 RepID=UPI00396A8FCE